jgi:hypothetical protein
MNMKVVVPNMNILGGDDVKPGFLLKAICKWATPFFRKRDSQEDVDRGDVEYDIGAYDVGHDDLETGRETANHLSLTIYDADKEVVVHCHLVLIIIRSSIESRTGHGGEIEWYRRDQSVGPSIKQHSDLLADPYVVDIRYSRLQSEALTASVHPQSEKGQNYYAVTPYQRGMHWNQS